MKWHVILFAALLGFPAGQPVYAQGNNSAAPNVPANPQRRAYFGDLHLHTGYSLDAYMGSGRTRLLPNDAYRFARGEPVSVMGRQLRRSRPLDFMAVTDHSEHLGVVNQLDNPNSELSKSFQGKVMRTLDGLGLQRFNLQTKKRTSPIFAGEAAAGKSAWTDTIEAANRNYKPGVFTTFIGYEYSLAPNASNLHRNVIFRGNVGPQMPFSALDSLKPEDLWSFLDMNRRAGRDAIVIPHNMNSSNGIAYPWFDSYGKPIDREYATRRAFNEPLSEIVQVKGSSDTNPVLNPSDEFANFEIYDSLTQRAALLKCGVESIDCQLENATERQLTENLACGAQALDCRTGAGRQAAGSYVRDGYGRGLVIAEKVGVNPYKFGVVGSTDIHSAMSESDEAATAATANPKARNYMMSSGGLMGAWAENNTRESLFDAFRRRETFATSGSEIKVRLFGGWDLPLAKQFNADWVKVAYAKGVPMGSDLPARPATAEAPRFQIWAEKDPNGANLERIQVIKVSTTGNGTTGDKAAYADKIFDVVRARKGGAAELKVVWQDPTFDPRRSASYYLRVLEVPTPRWSTLFAAKQGIELPPNVPRTIQERAWSSPIWYSAPAQSKTP